MNVLDVAKYFINKSTPGTQHSMTHLKLQKMVYYAHAWHLAIRDEPLVNDDKPEAWIHGPVFPKLYNEYRQYGFREIPKRKDYSDISIPENVQPILNFVWEYYGSKSGKQLEVLTHQEEPWKNARSNLGRFDYSQQVIPDEEIKEYFKKLLD